MKDDRPKATREVPPRCIVTTLTRRAAAAIASIQKPTKDRSNR